MLRRAAGKLARAVRRFNRRWIDALDPDYDPDATFAEAPPRPAAPVAPVAPARTVEVWAEPTPNPDAMKFSASVPVAPRGALSFDSAAAAADHPLGRAIFAVGSVRSMFAVNDFVTVTRTSGADWSTLVPRLEEAIAEALSR